MFHHIIAVCVVFMLFSTLNDTSNKIFLFLPPLCSCDPFHICLHLVLNGY